MPLLPSADVTALGATRYFSAVALTSLLWNHLLILGDEIELIWRKRHWSFVQTLVVANLYGAHGAMIGFAYVMSGMQVPLSSKVCRGFGVFIGVYGLIGIGLLQRVALLTCIVKVWDNRKSIRVALAIGLVICYGMGAAFDVLTIKQVINLAQYDVTARSCGLSSKATYLPGIWGGQLLYDLYVIVLLFVNSLSRPRRSDHEVVTNLVRDGGLLFIFLLVCRLVAFFNNLFGGVCFSINVSYPHAQLFPKAAETFIVLIFVYSLDVILTFKLFLKFKMVEDKVASDEDHRMTISQAVLIVEEIEMMSV
ncbi:uncharacterized protein LAESUDRAFT_684628 [Laetiporus sulphureus 93-53]|uniref:DUF6533 domain-containing protein n=1 Tax=Laetiporus sulphureus 93-53 TaxID=1314785 RepID=A0A165CH17_9APHY|nr:uncharacterized protein LAESUDRAFT_684628 [Laetiporus sulphureus 93-53]KZT02792.1 hypothetical protein LAESUDRAFT_684628 [Laetiporus sulphureus 93-53]